MPDVIVTTIIFSKEIDKEKLCDPMKALIAKGAGAESTCSICKRVMTSAPIEGHDGIAASEQIDGECPVTKILHENAW